MKQNLQTHFTVNRHLSHPKKSSAFLEESGISLAWKSLEDLWATVRAGHGKGSGSDVGRLQGKAWTEIQLCWRVAQCRDARSQKCVCAVSEVLGLVLVDYSPPFLVFFSPLNWVEATVGWEGESVAEGGLWVPCTCSVNRPSLFSCAWETFPALEEHSILQFSRKDPERIPLDL